MINPISHTNEGREYLLVEVPDKSRTFDLRFTANGRLYLRHGSSVGGSLMCIPIGEAEYSIISLASDATESQAAEIVETHGCWWRNYTNEMKTCFGPIHSLESLLTSHGLKMEGTLILQKL